MIILSQSGMVAIYAAQNGNLDQHIHADIIAQSRYDDYEYVDDEYSMQVLCTATTINSFNTNASPMLRFLHRTVADQLTETDDQRLARAAGWTC